MPANKGLVALVLILGLIVLAALGILVFGLVQRAKDPDYKIFRAYPAGPDQHPTHPAFGDVTVNLPPDATVKDYKIESGRLIVRVEMGPAEAPQTQLLILDAASGQSLGRVRLKRKP